MLAIAAALCVGVAGCGGGAHARGHKTVAYIITGAGQLESKPSSFCVSADGSNCFTAVRWSNWGASVATGTGSYTRQTCKPSCAAGPTLTYGVTLRASGTQNCQGKATYTSLAVTTQHKLSNGATETATLLPGAAAKCPASVSAASGPSRAPEPEARESPLAGESCELYRSGSDVRLELIGTGTSQKTCEKVAQKFSGEGGYWVAATPPEPEASVRQICALQAPAAAEAIVVDDSGGAFYGTRVCGVLAKDGWTLDHEIIQYEEEERQRREAIARKEAAEAERRASAAQARANAREANERAVEERQEKAEEEAQRRQEAKERQKEAAERRAEEEKQREEEAQQQREEQEEDERNEEEERG